jgi:hypothetical protein
VSFIIALLTHFKQQYSKNLTQIFLEPMVLWFKLVLVLSEVATFGGAIGVCIRLGGGIGTNE